MKMIHKAKCNIKKTLSMLLVFCMAFTMMPTVTFAASKITGSISVNGELVTDANYNNVLGNSTVLFDPVHNVLTLDSANLTQIGSYGSFASFINISGYSDFTINLIGTNKITNTYEYIPDFLDIINGITVLDGNLTITGTGSLEINMGKDCHSNGAIYLQDANNSGNDTLSMSSGSVSITTAEITETNAFYNPGIKAPNCTLTGTAHVKVEVGDKKIKQTKDKGVDAGMHITNTLSLANTAILEVRGGVISGERPSDVYTYAIVADKIVQNGGGIQAEQSPSNMGGAYGGIYTNSYTMNKGTLQCIGGEKQLLNVVPVIPEEEYAFIHREDDSFDRTVLETKKSQGSDYYNFDLTVGMPMIYVDDSINYLHLSTADDSVSYDPDTGILTLKNLNIQSSDKPWTTFQIKGGKNSQDITVNLIGNNVIKDDLFFSEVVDFYDMPYVTFTGDGTLNVNVSGDDNNRTVLRARNITMESGIINVETISADSIGALIGEFLTLKNNSQFNIHPSEEGHSSTYDDYGYHALYVCRLIVQDKASVVAESGGSKNATSGCEGIFVTDIIVQKGGYIDAIGGPLKDGTRGVAINFTTSGANSMTGGSRTMIGGKPVTNQNPGLSGDFKIFAGSSKETATQVAKNTDYLNHEYVEIRESIQEDQPKVTFEIVDDTHGKINIADYGTGGSAMMIDPHVNDGEPQKLTSAVTLYTTNFDDGDYQIKIYRRARDGGYHYADSDPVVIDMKKFPSSLLDDVKVENGVIVGVDNTMVYTSSTHPPVIWNDVPNGQTKLNLGIGTHKIKIPGTDTVFASDEKSLTITTDLVPEKITALSATLSTPEAGKTVSDIVVTSGDPSKYDAQLTELKEGTGNPNLVSTPATVILADKQYLYSVKFTPKKGYEFATGSGMTSVQVNGEALSGITTASTEVTGWEYITSTSAPAITRTITATAGANGAISPSGTVTVADGGRQTFTFTPDAGYEIGNLTVNGVTEIPTGNSYTITNVTADMAINVDFVKTYVPTLPTVTGDNQTVTVGTANDVIFTIDEYLDNFNRLKYNGSTLDSANYTAESGSIIITLKGNYVKTLAVGTHTFTAIVGNYNIPMNLIVEDVKKPPVTPTFNVSYDDGVASETIAVPTDTNDYESSDKVTVSTTIPTRDGYTFKGWIDESVTTVPVTITDGKFDMPRRDVVLVAQWEKKAVVVDPTPDETPKPDETSKPDTTPTPDTDTPQTGDNSNVWLLFALAVLSLGGISITVFKRKTEK